MNIKDQKTRAWIYRIVVAASPLAIIYGLASPEQTAAWVAVAGAILSVGATGLAAVNTATKKH